MPRPIDTDDVRRLLDDGAQLIETLPAEEYREAHLPGAVNVPLKELDGDAVEGFDRARAVVVYCHDHL